MWLWSEFNNTIIYAPVDDPLRRAYVRFVDSENKSTYVHADREYLNDNTMAMLVRRGGFGREDTPPELPWLINSDLDSSVGSFFTDLYETYKPDKRSGYAGMTPDELKAASARPEPLISEW